jgi:hypothetical protein
MSTKQKVKKKLVALGLSHATPPQQIVNAKHYVQSMTGNADFPSPSPTLATVSAQVAALEAAYDLSLTRARGTVGAMHVQLQTLNNLLKALAAYVENIANADPANASKIIAGAGMNEHKAPVKAPKTFTVRNGKVKGEVILNSKAVVRGTYIYEMTTDPNTASSWQAIFTGNTVRFVKTGLISATHYYFRVAVILKGVQGDWSPVLDLVVL